MQRAEHRIRDLRDSFMDDGFGDDAAQDDDDDDAYLRVGRDAERADPRARTRPSRRGLQRTASEERLEALKAELQDYSPSHPAAHVKPSSALLEF